MKRESLDELLARCAAYDGFSICGIAKSVAIKEFISRRNYGMPRSETTIRDQILSLLNYLKTMFEKLKKKGRRFSITSDGWTNFRGKRFIRLTVHSCKENYAFLEHVENKLKEFGLHLRQDIVASTHDGASVMAKYGSITGVLSQLCFNHAIHLAVMDIFYQKKNINCN